MRRQSCSWTRLIKETSVTLNYREQVLPHRQRLSICWVFCCHSAYQRQSCVLMLDLARGQAQVHYHSPSASCTYREEVKIYFILPANHGNTFTFYSAASKQVRVPIQWIEPWLQRHIINNKLICVFSLLPLSARWPGIECKWANQASR